jgi:chromosome segregation ATPase
MSDKKSLFGSIGSAVHGALFDDTPDAGKSPPVEDASSAPQTPWPPPPSVYTAQPSHVIDQAVRQKLEASVAESAPPGYVELQDTLASLAEAIPDEFKRWQAALKLTAKHGNTVEALLGDFDKCIGVLEQKDRQFDDETQAQLKRKVGDKKAHIDQLDQQIIQLQQQIADLTQQRSQEAATMTQDQQKILSVKESFDAAYQAVHSQLTERRAKLASFGKVSS